MTDCIHLNYIDEAVYFEFARGNPNIIALRDLQTNILKIRSLRLISYQVLCIKSNNQEQSNVNNADGMPF